MASSAKGNEKVVDGGGKRRKTVAKRKMNNAGGGDEEEARRKRNRTVLQFFEDTADVDDDDGNASEDSLFGDDFLDDVFDMGIGSGSGSKGPNETGKAPFVSFIPKEEQVTEEEFDKMLEERYKPGSNFVTYAEDNYESKRSVETPVETSTYLPSGKDPVIWKVKCMVGRERHSAFCLMQKYVDLKYLGTKLHIISAVALDHVKGFIYIEAEKQQHIYEACNGLCTIYASRVTPVPRDEISHLFSIRSIGTGITEGMWARVKSGTYKGDLAQVVAISNTRKKITVKLIPRVDLQALAEKFGRGITRHKADIPAPRLISSSELEEFRPLIQYRRDRDTNKIFEILDGMTLKDGYLYKKVSMDSLNFWGVTPKEDELLKFEPSKNDECNDLEWLTQLYGERKKKRPVISGKGSGKGEGSSSFSVENKFEVHDLVFFGGRKDRKDFGVIIGSEKDDSFKIIKEGSEGPVTVTLQARELKIAEFDKKLFTALDQKLMNISVNDAVRVLDGPLKDKQGVVKKIYGGVIFLFNEIEEENNGYMCTKARFCEKVEPTGGACNDKTGEPGSSAFGEFSSPKSPLSPEQSQQERGGCKFNRESDDTFSVGQLLRIRLGPLKGYLCRVLAVRRSDVTVKLDSQHKILTVKRDHVSEVRGRSSGISTGADADSVKPFDLLGEQDGSRDWMNGAATATATETEGGGWNLGGLSTERSSVDEDGNKDNSSWGAKATPSQGSSWGAAGAALETAAGNEEVAGWGGHKKAASTTGSGDGASDSWGKAAESSHQTTDNSSWGVKATPSSDNSSWGAKATPSQGSSWGAAGAALESAAGNKEVAGWGGQMKAASSTGFGDGASDSWGKEAESCHQTTDKSSWGTKATPSQGSSWGAAGAALETVAGKKEVAGWGGQMKAASGTGFGDGASDQPEGSAWNKSTTVNEIQTNSWGTIKKDEGSTGGWGKKASTSDKNVEDEERVSTEESKNDAWGTSTDKNIGGDTASWSKQDGGSTSWSKPDGGSSSWTKKDGGSSFNKVDGGASWNSTAGLRNEDGTDQGSWGRQGAFDGGRDSGGRRGRGGGRGGRDQFGRGRSFGQDQNTNWKNGDQDDRGSSRRIFGENKSSWTSGQGGGWKEPGGSGEEKSDWNSKSSSWQNSESAQGWGTPKTSLDNNSGDVDNSGGGSWNSKKSSEGGSSSGWGQTKLDGTKDAGGNIGSWGASKSSTDKNTGNADNSGGGGWNSKKSSEAGSSSGWGQSNLDGTGNAGGNQGPWGSKGDWGASKDSVDKNTENADNGGGGWNSKKSSEGGSSSGWGQSKWGGTTDAGGNQGSWGSKGNWSSEKNLGGSEEKTETFGGRGDGSWRGGRGGRWGSDGGSFGDRGGSDRGGFRGRGGSDRGGFGGRGRSDRGDFGGRGRSDGGDFGGRGGFGGRGRGRRDDWNNNNESGDGGSSGWKSEGGAGGWSNTGGGRGRGRRDDWNNNNESGDGGSSGWKSEGGAGGWSNTGGGRGRGRRDDWNNNNESGDGGSSGWKSEGGAGGWSNSGGGRGRGRRDDWKSNNESGDGGTGWKPEGGAGGWSNSSGGRGRGRRDDWKNNNESGDGGSSGWKSEGGAGGWSNSSGGRGRGRRDDWKNNNESGDGGSSGWKSEGAAGGGDRAQTGGWNKTSAWSSDAKDGGPSGGGDNWKSANSSDGTTSSSWNQPPASGVEGAAGSSWGKPNNESDKGSSLGQPNNESSKGNSWGQPNIESSKGSSWGQPGSGSSSGNSWDKPSDGSSKGGW